MPRNNSNSLWYLPLVASTEEVSRAGSTYDPNILIPALPGPPPWNAYGLTCWFDANVADSTITQPDGGVVLVHDRSGNGYDAAQPNMDQRPTIDTTLLTPRALQFE